MHVCIYMFVGKVTSRRASSKQSPYDIFSSEPTQCYQRGSTNDKYPLMCEHVCISNRYDIKYRNYF